MQLALYGPFANSWGGLQPLLVGKARQPHLLYACFLYPDSNFPQLFGMSSLPEVGVLLSRTWACRCVCSGCPSDHKCVQFVFKTSLHHYINIQSCYFMQKFISPAILGMFQTVAVPQSQLRCCAVGAVRAICKAESGFQKQLLALWCLHVGSLLHTDVAQPPRSQMTPLAWCPTVDSEQSSRVTDSRARCTDIDITAVKNQFSCV